jgi:hypothetical protein
MLLGHFGVAFALKRAEPRLSLGTLFFAVGLVDTAWGVFLLLGWEQARIVPGWTVVSPFEFVSYPLTHSLVAGVLWAVVAGAIVYSWPTRDTSRHHWLRAMVVALAVVSHWFLDVIVHIPDLPLAGDSSKKFGFGLWNNLPATIAVELLFFFGGLALYLRWRARTQNAINWRIAVPVVLLLALFFGSILGPPPPNMRFVAIADLFAAALFTGLAVWADRTAGPAHKTRAATARA